MSLLPLSKRPTTVARKACENAVSSLNTYGYAIIGDTASSVLYAQRLLGNHVTTPIAVITQGVDRTTDSDITDITFPATNITSILHFLISERIHYIPAGDDPDVPDDGDINFQTERVIQYYVGAGPLGDFISNYHITSVGPWFPHGTNGRLTKFIAANTVEIPLSAQETVIMTALMANLNLPATCSVVVRSPAVLNTHILFLNKEQCSYNRQVFLSQYQYVNQASNVDIASQSTNIQFAAGSGTGLYDVSTGSGVVLTNVKLVWQTNPYTYLDIATSGGLCPRPLSLPSRYRCVVAIPLHGRVDFSGISPRDDLVTTDLTFSCYDLFNPKSSSLTWLVEAYTAAEDLSVVNTTGKYADAGSTLLIIEALNLKNRRKTSYNVADAEVLINYNDRTIETAWLNQFATLCAAVYNAFTGLVITTDTLLGFSSICTSGACTDSVPITDVIFREMPITSVMELTAQLYTNDVYPTVGKCQ